MQEYIGLSSSEHVLSIGVHVLLEIGAVLPLVELAHNEEPQVRLFAVSALGRIQTFADTNLLMKLLAGEDDAEVRKACWIALARKGDEAALLELQDQIRKTTDWKLKLEYANLLVELGRSEFYQVFGELLQANDPAARWSAISRLKRLEGPIAGPYLLRAVQDADPRVRRSARFALAGILNDPPPELLREGLESDDPMLAAAWIEAVGRLNLQIDVSQPLRRALTSGNPLAEEKSFDYIEVHDRREFRPLLVEMLRTSIEQKQDRNAVSRILRILGRWDDRECLELVKEAYLKDVFGLGSSAACADFIVRVSEPDEAITFFRDVLRREYDLYLGGLDRKQILAAAMLVRLLDGPPRGPESLPE